MPKEVHALARLRRNLDLNGVAEQTILFPGAALDQTGQTTIVTIEGQEEYSSLNAIVHPSVAAAPRLLERVNRIVDELAKCQQVASNAGLLTSPMQRKAFEEMEKQRKIAAAQEKRSSKAEKKNGKANPVVKHNDPVDEKTVS